MCNATLLNLLNFMASLFWFRNDLRLEDNPALAACVASGQPVLCLYIYDETEPHAPGAASRVWLHHALHDLQASLKAIGLPLLIAKGPADKALKDIISTYDIDECHWNRHYEPAMVARDTALKAALRENGVKVHSHQGSVLIEPWEPRTGAGQPYRVFTPFYKSLLAKGIDTREARLPETPVKAIAAKTGLSIDDLRLLPQNPRWDRKMEPFWDISEKGAQQRLAEFLHNKADYAAGRDIPSLDATSRLSPYLHFGQISPRRIWNACAHSGQDHSAFLRELVWREFSIHLLYHNPDLPSKPLQKPFARFPWRADAADFDAWKAGRTGYPIVDAGMRQLWETGWMHNRVRMIVASFLVKHLLLPWQDGEAWFWDCLVDADLANNSASWQWVAGSGADAAPYFRVFNPILQGEKFDPKGDYVRRWCPELAGVADKFVHKPWLGGGAKGYPAPIVDHGEGRMRALSAYQSLKKLTRALETKRDSCAL